MLKTYHKKYGQFFSNKSFWKFCPKSGELKMLCTKMYLKCLNLFNLAITFITIFIRLCVIIEYILLGNMFLNKLFFIFKLVRLNRFD